MQKYVCVYLSKIVIYVKYMMSTVHDKSNVNSEYSVTSAGSSPGFPPVPEDTAMLTFSS